MMIKKIFNFCLIVLLGICLISCKEKKNDIPDSVNKTDNYENIYQVFVRSYADSNNDGIGDFKGLEQKLDYIKELGFTAIWLMPIHPSPSYHGYDVTDYYDVNSDYGTLTDFKSLTKKAKQLGIDIYIDFVVNHSSNEHEWFKKAINNESPYKDYYVFSNSSSNSYWHGAGNGKYYYGYFSSSMPDLNLKNEAVINEIKNIASFWIEQGVSGFRLDGALHYFRIDEYNSKAAIYTNAVTSVIKVLQNHCKSINPNFNIIVEAWDSYLNYAPTFKADASPLDFNMSDLILDTACAQNNTKFFYQMSSFYNEYAKYDKDYCPTPFLMNHDMDRLASYKSFADDTNLQRFAAEILLSMPGSPVVYYGEEIGMKGIRAEGRNGQYDETVRLPYVSGDETQTSWTTDYNNYNNITSAKKQLDDSSSLLNSYKKLLNLRNNNIALKYGNSFTKVDTNNSSLICYTRTVTYQNKTQTILVIHNVSSFSQTMPNVSGKLLYSTTNNTKLEEIETISGKTTLIVDITKGYIK